MTNMNTNTTLSLDDLAAVNGGTFTPNTYEKWMYEKAGFTCNFHFLAKDEFIYNGVTYHEAEANKIMESLGWSTKKEYASVPHAGTYEYTDIYYKGERVERR